MAKKEREIKLPNKTTMNLLVVENDNSKQLPYFLVGLVVVGICAFLFAQFLVINRLNKLNVLQGEVSRLQQAYNEQLQYLSDYDQVKEKYSRYTTVYLTKDNERIVDREEIIDLINESIKDLGSSSSFSIVDNSVSFVVLTENQNDLARIRSNFEKSPIVKDVELASSTTTRDGVQSTINVRVVMEER